MTISAVGAPQAQETLTIKHSDILREGPTLAVSPNCPFPDLNPDL